jgi:hypothetical protein
VLKRASGVARRGWVQLLRCKRIFAALTLCVYTFDDDAEARGVIVCAFELLICVLLDRVHAFDKSVCALAFICN